MNSPENILSHILELSADEGTVVAAMLQNHGVLSTQLLAERLTLAGFSASKLPAVIDSLVLKKFVEMSRDTLRLTKSAYPAFLKWHAEARRLLDPSPDPLGVEFCSSLPWITTVQTEWIEGISLNYRVDPKFLDAILPSPLEADVFKGYAWVQVLVSSLREMRPQGMAGFFGVNFYQISYRAQVKYKATNNGAYRRGGYFLRSETNHGLMAAVGNHLKEFKFHDFGLAEMIMAVDGDHQAVTVDSERPGGNLVAILERDRSVTAPTSSVWSSLSELKIPLIDCNDAVAPADNYMYLLTIDRDEWKEKFVPIKSLYCEYFENGPLAGHCEIDSALHIPACKYRWRPLRRMAIES